MRDFALVTRAIPDELQGRIRLNEPIPRTTDQAHRSDGVSPWLTSEIDIPTIIERREYKYPDPSGEPGNGPDN